MANGNAPGNESATYERTSFVLAPDRKTPVLRDFASYMQATANPPASTVPEPIFPKLIVYHPAPPDKYDPDNPEKSCEGFDPGGHRPEEHPED
jgi:hypothetical protein